jgi:hypothetical protein
MYTYQRSTRNVEDYLIINLWDMSRNLKLKIKSMRCTMIYTDLRSRDEIIQYIIFVARVHILI